jgi:hypothetical protein
LILLVSLVSSAFLGGCASREEVPVAPEPARSSDLSAEDYLGAAHYLQARTAAERELDAARARGDREAMLAAYLRLGEALVGLEEHSKARGYLVQVKRDGDAPQREAATALLALSHDREGHHELARSYYLDVRQSQVDPRLWRRVSRRFSHYVTEPAAIENRPRTASTSHPLGLTILPRSRWSRVAFRTHLADHMERITKITIHHTGMVTYPMSISETAQHLRSIQRNHFARGWADIGYHYVIDSSGRIWAGRPVEYQGAHAGNHELNRRNIGIALTGDFNVQRVPAVQREALAQLLAMLTRRYGISKEQIYDHGAVRNTQCPGFYLSRALPQIVRELDRRTVASRTHIVVRGETLARIARHYGVSLSSLRALNPRKGDDLRPGELVAVP